MRATLISISGMPDQAPGEIVFRAHVSGLPDGMSGFSTFGETPDEAFEKMVKLLLEEAKRVYFSTVSTDHGNWDDVGVTGPVTFK